MKKKDLPKLPDALPNVDALVEAFNGDLNLLNFYAVWIKNGMNATAAYQELHPDVTYGSARELGARSLARIDKRMLMRAYGLDEQAYFTQLHDGISATKWNDFTGEREPDHTTRIRYHDKLGKLLGIESDKPATLIQMNTNEMNVEFGSKDEGNLT